MNVQKSKEILKRSTTYYRESAGNSYFFDASQKAYSFSDIERDLDKFMDRVTVYLVMKNKMNKNRW
jgi:hypothetical protein